MTRWQFYVAPFHGDRAGFIDRFAGGVLPALAQLRSGPRP
jgi:hypothetical protein